ncbi:MAG: GAF domain-containing protein [Verrucomicrobia bacterium]|nr:GAF domain-containing protein [Verrucomicrobiota bacterium]NBY36598.1 GAF domain-containing protein [Verrucomicrobiota bacterium]
MSNRTAGLAAHLVGSIEWHEALAHILKSFDCVTGTLHRTDPSTGLLMLIAHQGIPPQVQAMLLPKIDNIPFGKGIAGCAASRKKAVQLCNLQEDLGGVAKPDARKTNVQGALAVPVLGVDGKVIGVLGIGKMQPYDFLAEEISDLDHCAALIAPHL